MVTPSPKQRRELRAKAHSLHPVVSIGQHGLTPAVMREIDVALRAHALVKVRVFSEDRAEREGMLASICTELDAAPVQHIGKLLILWRPPEEAPAKPPQKRARKTAAPRKSAKGKAPRERVAPRERNAESQRRPPAGGKRIDGRNSAPQDAHRRRRRTAADEGASGSSGASTRRKPEPAAEGTRPPRGRSAPNPRRRRAS